MCSGAAWDHQPWRLFASGLIEDPTNSEQFTRTGINRTGTPWSPPRLRRSVGRVLTRDGLGLHVPRQSPHG
jgi:hypothetical protein